MSTTKKLNVRFSVLAGMILLAAFSRLVPHMTNFSPLGTIGLFGAAYFVKKWQAFLVPIAATWLSDLFINNVIYAQYYPQFTWFYHGFYWQYGSYLVIVLVSLLVIMRKLTVTRVISGAIASSAIFFFISNFGVWLNSHFYPQNTAGLLQCYTAALPFLKGTLYGNLFYAGILFGGFAYAQKQYPVLRLQHSA